MLNVILSYAVHHRLSYEIIYILFGSFCFFVWPRFRPTWIHLYVNLWAFLVFRLLISSLILSLRFLIVIFFMLHNFINLIWSIRLSNRLTSIMIFIATLKHSYTHDYIIVLAMYVQIPTNPILLSIYQYSPAITTYPVNVIYSCWSATIQELFYVIVVMAVLLRHSIVG